MLLKLTANHNFPILFIKIHWLLFKKFSHFQIIYWLLWRTILDFKVNILAINHKVFITNIILQTRMCPCMWCDVWMNGKHCIQTNGKHCITFSGVASTLSSHYCLVGSILLSAESPFSIESHKPFLYIHFYLPFRFYMSSCFSLVRQSNNVSIWLGRMLMFQFG